jgi:hypothetical protein
MPWPESISTLEASSGETSATSRVSLVRSLDRRCRSWVERAPMNRQAHFHIPVHFLRRGSCRVEPSESAPISIPIYPTKSVILEGDTLN